MARRSIRLLLGALSALALGLMVRAALQGWEELRSADASVSWGWFGLSLVFAAAAMVWIAVRWQAVLVLCGCAVPMRVTVPMYFAGEIGKYVPGGIWPVVGRGELAVRRGAGSRSAVYRAVLLSMIYLILGGLVVAALVWVVALGVGLPLRWWALVLLALPAGLVALMPGVAGWGAGIVRRFAPKLADSLVLPPLRTSVVLVGGYVPAWLLIVVSMLCTSKAVGVVAGWSVVATAATIPWLIGMFVIPAPGGLGAREAVVGSVLAGVARPGQAALFAVASRVAFVLVDAFGALVAAAMLRSRRK